MPWEMHSNKQTAIKDLNLRVHSGQMLAVIGSSGTVFKIFEQTLFIRIGLHNSHFFEKVTTTGGFRLWEDLVTRHHNVSR